MQPQSIDEPAEQPAERANPTVHTAPPPGGPNERELILGEPVDAVGKADAVRKVIDRALVGEPGAYVCLTNVHSTTDSRRIAPLRAAAHGAFLSVPDGMPLVWILRRRGFKRTEKITGVEFAPLVVEAGLEKKVRHYFYGSAPGVAEAAGRALKQRFPEAEVVGASTPPFAEEWPLDELQDELRRTRPHIMWVGLGAPKQEIWMSEVAGTLDVPMMIGIGAGFDFLAGTKKAAPSFSRHIGLEWLFRLLMEPRRLWRRYILGNSLFVVLLLREAISRRRRPT